MVLAHVSALDAWSRVLRENILGRLLLSCGCVGPIRTPISLGSVCYIWPNSDLAHSGPCPCVC